MIGRSAGEIKLICRSGHEAGAVCGGFRDHPVRPDPPAHPEPAVLVVQPAPPVQGAYVVSKV
jgi:hypothetical protein